MYVKFYQPVIVWNQRSGTMYLADTKDGRALIGVGYSGSTCHQNKPESERIVAKGPIPRGVWTMGSPFAHQTLGPVSIPLWPVEKDAAFGRSGFYIHGDNSKANGSASTGCIILNRPARDFIVRSGVSTLIVV